jgi:hypothetical protein
MTALEEVKGQLRHQTALLNSVLAKLDTAPDSVRTTLPESVSLPLNTMEEVDRLEEDLQADTALLKCLVSIYHFFYEIIYRALKYSFCNIS